jgi:hypothetical protein
MEFLVNMTTHVPNGTSEDAVDDMRRSLAPRASASVAGCDGQAGSLPLGEAVD